MHYAFTIFYVSPATEIYHFTGNRSATDHQVEVLGLPVCAYQFKCSTIVGALSNKHYEACRKCTSERLARHIVRRCWSQGRYNTLLLCSEGLTSAREDAGCTPGLQFTAVCRWTGAETWTSQVGLKITWPVHRFAMARGDWRALSVYLDTSCNNVHNAAYITACSI